MYLLIGHQSGEMLIPPPPPVASGQHLSEMMKVIHPGRKMYDDIVKISGHVGAVGSEDDVSD